MTEPVFRAEPYARSCAATVVAAGPGSIVLDRTVFYARGGGQPGDTGRLVFADGSTIEIVDTTKGDSPEAILHVPAEGGATPAVGAGCQAELDWDRRYRLMRMHTAMHLLSAVLPYPVTGGQVGDGKGRLDFDIPEAGLDKEALDVELQRLIAADHPVAEQWITDQEMAERPDLVKTMSVKPPSGLGQVRLIEIEGCDLQPCGGTHVARTGEIGRVTITKIKKKGQQNRRVSLALVD